MNTNELHQIVIVGGGAGGLELATRLGRKLGKSKKAKIILVDANRTHLWKPLLHEVASGSLNAFEDELNYFAQAKWNYFDYVPGKMQGINRKDKTIELAEMLDESGQPMVPTRNLSYDTLVIAVGSTANDFNTPGAKEHCLFLDNREQAEKIHHMLINHYMRAQALHHEDTKLKVAIIGAGATGVELAAELHHAAIELENYGLNAIKHGNLEVTIIEGANRILPVLPERISNAVHQELTKLGVNILTERLVSNVKNNGLETRNGAFIEVDLKIWAAGIKAPMFLNQLDDLETNRINQLIVKPTLQTTKDDSIYALGDCAFCKISDSKGKEFIIPPRAQVAHQQAAFLAKSLVAKITKDAPAVEFKYTDYGSLISLSKFTAVGNLMGLMASSKSMTVEGKLAKMFYISLYRMHQMTLFGKFRTIMLILRDTLGKPVRPHLKLH